MNIANRANAAIAGRVRSCLLLAALACFLHGCARAADAKARLARPAGPQEEIYAILFNSTGQQLNGATVEDSGGGQTLFELPVTPGFIDARGPMKRPKGASDDVVIRWSQGAGRISWREARLPLKVNPAQRDFSRIEIYLRPDGRVCGELLNEQHRPQSEADGIRRSTIGAPGQTCSDPVRLQDAVPGSAGNFSSTAIQHTWEKFDHGGQGVLNLVRLNHETGPIRIRHGNAFRGDGPWYLDEFSWARDIGPGAALLLEADLKPASPALFVVQGTRSAWEARYVGVVLLGNAERLDPDHVFFPPRIVLEISTGRLFTLPYEAGMEYDVLGLHAGSRQLALVSFRERDEPGDAVDVSAFDLESGLLAPRAGRVTIPESAIGVRASIRQWFAKNCRWTSEGSSTSLRCDGRSAANARHSTASQTGGLPPRSER